MYNKFLMGYNFSGFNPLPLCVIIATCFISGILIITSKSLIISVLSLVLLFGSTSFYLVHVGLKFIGIFHFLVLKSKYSTLFNYVLDLINILIAFCYYIISYIITLYNKYSPWIIIIYCLFCITNIIIYELNLYYGFLYINNNTSPSASPNPSSPQLPNNSNPLPSDDSHWYKTNTRTEQNEEESDWAKTYREQDEEIEKSGIIPYYPPDTAPEQDNSATATAVSHDPRCENMRVNLQEYRDNSVGRSPLLSNNRNISSQDEDFICEKVVEYKNRNLGKKGSWGHFHRHVKGEHPNRTYGGPVTQKFIDNIFGPNNR